MPVHVIRAMADGDLDWVHALNTVHQQALSPLSPGELHALARSATLARVFEPRDGFLLAFDQDADYGGVNFQWFRARYPRFLYVDRIAVDQSTGRRGLGRHLYNDLMRYARRMGYPRVTAEINADPPNPASDAFHDRFGFATVGEAALQDRGKTVRYVSCTLNA